jgi:hypothetical protein
MDWALVAANGSAASLASIPLAHLGTLNSRRQAGAALRSAFAAEIAKVRLAQGHDKKIDIEEVLTDAFLKHAAAIEEFRFFVKPQDRAAYERGDLIRMPPAYRGLIV